MDSVFQDSDSLTIRVMTVKPFDVRLFGNVCQAKWPARRQAWVARHHQRGATHDQTISTRHPHHSPAITRFSSYLVIHDAREISTNPRSQTRQPRHHVQRRGTQGGQGLLQGGRCCDPRGGEARFGMYDDFQSRPELIEDLQSEPQAGIDQLLALEKKTRQVHRLRACAYAATYSHALGLRSCVNLPAHHRHRHNSQARQ
jgi:hypothetical protein